MYSLGDLTKSDVKFLKIALGYTIEHSDETGNPNKLRLLDYLTPMLT